MFNFYFSSPNELRINTIIVLHVFRIPKHQIFENVTEENENKEMCFMLQHKHRQSQHSPSLSCIYPKNQGKKKLLNRREHKCFCADNDDKVLFSVLNIFAANWFCINYNCCWWLFLSTMIHEFKWSLKFVSYQSTTGKKHSPFHHECSARGIKIKQQQQIGGTSSLQFDLRKVQQEHFKKYIFFFYIFARANEKNLTRKKKRQENIQKSSSCAHTHDKNTSSAR